MTIGARRGDRFDLTFVGAALAAFIVLLSLGAGATFFADEWAFIESRSLTDLTTWLPPHNEHWSTVPLVLYRLLVETVGLGTYIPYLACVLVLHVIVAALVYRFVRRSSGPAPALAVAAVVLLLGAGFENLFMAFQTIFVGATAAGLGALMAFEYPVTARRATAGVLLVIVALASSGVGLTFAALVGFDLLLDRRRIKYVVLLTIPAAVYGAWYLAFGRTGVATVENPFRLEALTETPGFVVEGLGNAAGAISGTGPTVGIGVAALVGAFAVFRFWRDGLSSGVLRFLACALALVVHYSVIGLVRAELDIGAANYTRYTYESAVILFIGLFALVGTPRLPAPGIARPMAVAVAASLLAVSLAWNVRLLFNGRDIILARADMTRALVTVALDPNKPPGADLDRSLVLVPSARTVERLVARYGSPLEDGLVPWGVRRPPPDVMATAQRWLAEGAPVPGQ